MSKDRRSDMSKEVVQYHMDDGHEKKVKQRQISQDQNVQRISTKTMTLAAMMTAVTCVLAPFSIPIGPVPISLTNLVIYFGLYLLGTRKELLSYIVYLLIGFAGIPVFSGFTGGAGKLLGPTGGYLIGFIFMVLAAGPFIEKSGGRPLASVTGMILGTAICYALGTVWFCIEADYKLVPALMLCVIPFLPGDAVKIAVAAILGPQIKRQLDRIG